MYTSARTLFEVYREELVRLTGEIVPLWHELPWEEQMDWQYQADEINESRNSQVIVASEEDR